MRKRVEIQIDHHVAEFALCQPKKFNVLDPETIAQLADAGEQLKHNAQIRALVLHGEGKNFCSGLDISLLKGALTDNATFAERELNPGEAEIANLYQKAVIARKE